MNALLIPAVSWSLHITQSNSISLQVTGHAPQANKEPWENKLQPLMNKMDEQLFALTGRSDGKTCLKRAKKQTNLCSAATNVCVEVKENRCDVGFMHQRTLET